MLDCEKMGWGITCVCLSIQPLSFVVNFNFGIIKYVKVGARHNNDSEQLDYSAIMFLL